MAEDWKMHPAAVRRQTSHRDRQEWLVLRNARQQALERARSDRGASVPGTPDELLPGGLIPLDAWADIDTDEAG